MYVCTVATVTDLQLLILIRLFKEKFFCSLKLMSSRRSIMKSCMQCWKESALLEACKFVKTFISFINVAIYLA